MNRRKTSSSGKKMPGRQRARQPEPVIEDRYYEDDRRRVEELIDEHGWEFLRVKEKTET